MKEKLHISHLNGTCKQVSGNQHDYLCDGTILLPPTISLFLFIISPAGCSLTQFVCKRLQGKRVNASHFRFSWIAENKTVLSLAAFCTLTERGKKKTDVIILTTTLQHSLPLRQKIHFYEWTLLSFSRHTNCNFELISFPVSVMLPQLRH